MLEFLQHIDEQVFTAINNANGPIMDEVMYWVSYKLSWIPMYLLLLVALVRKFGWKQTALIALMVIPLILLADQIASGFLKPTIERYRPCNSHSVFEGMVHIVRNKCGGPYGFVSSHAANFFALATYFALVFGGKHRALQVFFFACAILVAYSRIYLGVHFPGDVICGGLLGIGIGTLIAFLYRKLQFKIA